MEQGRQLTERINSVANGLKELRGEFGSFKEEMRGFKEEMRGTQTQMLEILVDIQRRLPAA
ncbi:hypothetical protein [Nonomuraea sp. NPDC050783]|uniref:hypothetical protein n=1 Tax=Nonomuraea sp. NPDC050783 TaxID=3154634 RepID=UPI0034664C15